MAQQTRRRIVHNEGKFIFAKSGRWMGWWKLKPNFIEISFAKQVAKSI